MTRIEEIREAGIMGATPASNGTIVIIPNIAAAPGVNVIAQDRKS